MAGCIPIALDCIQHAIEKAWHLTQAFATQIFQNSLKLQQKPSVEHTISPDHATVTSGNANITQ